MAFKFLSFETRSKEDDAKNAETSEMSTLSIVIQFLNGHKAKIKCLGDNYQVCGPNERSAELN